MSVDVIFIANPLDAHNNGRKRRRRNEIIEFDQFHHHNGTLSEIKVSQLRAISAHTQIKLWPYSFHIQFVADVDVNNPLKGVFHKNNFIEPFR